MKKQIRIFVTGALVVIALAVPLYLVYWAATKFSELGEAALPEGYGWLGPVVGVAMVLVAIYFIGVLMHWWVFRWAVSLAERAVRKLPIIKTIYEGVRDILRLFSGASRQTGKVVRYRIPDTDIEMLGIQTTDSPRGTATPGKVAVYLPMSYQLGGFTLYLSASAVEPVDMTVEEAMKLAATAEAGVSAKD